MIFFDGIIKKNGNICILRFKNEAGAIADIPLEQSIANIISLHLSKISTPSKTVERNNIEESDVYD